MLSFWEGSPAGHRPSARPDSQGEPRQALWLDNEANRNFDIQYPLVFLEQGYEGILAVRRYLDFERGF